MTLPTITLKQAGQSPWLDNLSRSLIRSGKLKGLIAGSGLLGVTSNPTIFEKAISHPDGGYDADIQRLIRRGAGTFHIYDSLTVSDIRETCDAFASVHESSGTDDGFVSLEVSPGLADDTEATVSEALRLVKAVGRPNLMIKVPATCAGIGAVRRLVGGGINVNATLIFSVSHYRDVAKAYIEGLQDFRRRGGDLRKVHSVASVFVSRFDTLIDKRLDAMAAAETDSVKRAQLCDLAGKAACANAKQIYQEFKAILSSPEFMDLRENGAFVQKVLWGSTGTKNPSYPDLLYVEGLVGSETVNTMPEATLEALLDHGQVRTHTVEEGLDDVRETVRRLGELGIDLEQVGQVLQKEGVKAFVKSFDALMSVIEQKRFRSARHCAPVKIAYAFGHARPLADQGARALERADFHARFFQGDPGVWKKEDAHQRSIRNRLGWVRVTGWMMGKLYELDQIAGEVRREGVRDLVLLGMGGSSLAPMVMNGILGRRPGSPRLHVLDSTDPATLVRLEKSLNWERTIVIVSSKSGGTIETLTQFRYFFDRAGRKLGAKAGRQFVAVTDENSGLELMAREKNFRRVFINPSDIGGRYSALSYFGLLPAALAGMDVRRLVWGAHQLLESAEKTVPIEKNPAIFLGAFLGAMANAGRDKLTFWIPKPLAVFGGWVEQLVAESTGKEGKGIVPVIGDQPAAPSVYGKDRAFVVISLKGQTGALLKKRVREVKKAGFPVIEMTWPDRYAIGTEFLRWEIATAAASSVMGINPFDEPNVKESKDAAKTVLEEIKSKGISAATRGLSQAGGRVPFQKIFAKIKPGAYVSLLAYTDYLDKTQQAFARLQTKIRDRFRVPVLFGFGPRYLHSIGQLYKGGSPNGIFLEFFMREKKDVKVPGGDFSFGQLKTAQALGDYKALAGRKRRILAVDLGKDVLAGIRKFESRMDGYFKETP